MLIVSISESFVYRSSITLLVAVIVIYHRLIVYVSLVFVLCMSNFVESLSFPLLFMLVLMLQSTACLKVAFYLFFFLQMGILGFIFTLVLGFLQG